MRLIFSIVICAVNVIAGAAAAQKSVPDDVNWSPAFGIPGANKSVNAVTSDVSGNIYIGGEFSLVGNIPANYVAKWNPVTSAWSNLGAGTTGHVLALAGDLLGGVYVGGAFTAAGGDSASCIARWDGNSWSALGSGMTGGPPSVNALAVDGAGNVFAGGTFTAAGGVTASNIAMWNGSAWFALGGGVNGPVLALAVHGADVYAGGGFSTAGGLLVNGIAKWNGTSWSALGTGMDLAVSSLAVDSHGVLYAGGGFTTAGGVTVNGVARWDSPGWAALGAGVGWYVWALDVDTSGELYAGCWYDEGGFPTAGVAKWDGDAWTFDEPGQAFNIYDLAFDPGGNLYAAGMFAAVGDRAANNIAKWNRTTWSPLGSGLGMGDVVFALAEDSWGNVYAGGSFRSAGNAAANFTAKYDGTKWEPLGAGLDGYVSALAIDASNNVYAGGAFSSAGSVAAENVAMWNGTAWSRLGTGLDDTVLVLAVGSDNTVYAGGEFTMAGALAVNHVAKWNGTAWEGLGTGMDDVVEALVVDGSDLYVGGWFATAGGTAANRVAKWNGSGWSALGTGMDNMPVNGGCVLALDVDGAGNLYAGGYFSVAGGVAVSSLAKWNGLAWSAFGGVGGNILALDAVAPGLVYAGGFFSEMGGVSASNVAKWNGTDWERLGSGASGGVLAVAADTSGRVFAGGTFALAGDKISANLGLWQIHTTGILHPPIVLGTTPTGDTTPTWTWVSGGGGNGMYRYQLQTTGGSWTETLATSYTPASALADGPHTLFVEERNTIGQWSAWGSFTIVVDSGLDRDEDGDGLTGAEEDGIGTGRDDADSDDDGMDDGYEHQYGLDPLNGGDVFEDTDGDGYTNFEEYLMGSDPGDAESPRHTVYVVPVCGDNPGYGTEDAPWCSIAYALEHVTPTEQAPVTIVLAAGTYTENLTLKPYVVLSGPTDGSVATIEGAITAADSTEVRNLRIKAPPTGVPGVLLDIPAPVATIYRVELQGAAFTGIRVDSEDGSSVLLDQCTLLDLAAGVEIVDALPTIRRCVFSNIDGDALVVRARAGGKATDSGTLGAVGDANSGYNTFDVSAILGYAVLNERAGEPLVMENNDWGTNDLGEVAGKLGGDGAAEVDFEPILPKDAGMMAASVFCLVWGAADRTPIENASITLTPGAFNPVTENTAGVYTFACVAPGNWTFTVSAPGWADASQSVTVEAEDQTSLLYPMSPGTPGEGEGEDGDEDDPPPGCFG